MLEISNSSLSTYQTCQKKWAWLFIEGLKPRYKSSALTLGDIMHKTFDKYYKGLSIDAISIVYLGDSVVLMIKAPSSVNQYVVGYCLEKVTCGRMFCRYMSDW